MKCPVCCHEFDTPPLPGQPCPVCGCPYEGKTELSPGMEISWEWFNKAIGAGAPCADCPIRDEKVVIVSVSHSTVRFRFRGKEFYAYSDILTTCEMLMRHFKQCDKPISPSITPDPLQGGVGFGGG